MGKNDPGSVADESVGRLFEVMDVNGDGRVTFVEFQNAMSKVFPSWTSHSLVPLFREIDSGETGDICKDELVAYVRVAFAKGV